MTQLPYRAVIVDLDRTLLRTDKSGAVSVAPSGRGIRISVFRRKRLIIHYDSGDTIKRL